MTTQNGQGSLLKFYLDWRQAQERVTMAQQTLERAGSDALLKEARFKGAAELMHGADATFEYSEKEGLRFTQPNRETRRALAKARRKK